MEADKVQEMREPLVGSADVRQTRRARVRLQACVIDRIVKYPATVPAKIAIAESIACSESASRSGGSSRFASRNGTKSRRIAPNPPAIRSQTGGWNGFSPAATTRAAWSANAMT